MSGPILDRIDLYVDVHEIDNSQLLAERTADTAKTVRDRVMAARKAQAERFGDVDTPSSGMTNRDIRRHAQLNPAAKDILDQAAKTFELSAHAYLRCVKVARTTADLDGSTVIAPQHVAEVLQYRPHTYHDE